MEENHTPSSQNFSSRSAGSGAQGQKGWEWQLWALFFNMSRKWQWTEDLQRVCFVRSLGNQQTSHHPIPHNHSVRVGTLMWPEYYSPSDISGTFPQQGPILRGKRQPPVLKQVEFCLSITTLHLVCNSSGIVQCAAYTTIHIAPFQFRLLCLNPYLNIFH